jgi:hypothetical protein
LPISLTSRCRRRRSWCSRSSLFPGGAAIAVDLTRTASRRLRTGPSGGGTCFYPLRLARTLPIALPGRARDRREPPRISLALDPHDHLLATHSVAPRIAGARPTLRPVGAAVPQPPPSRPGDNDTSRGTPPDFGCPEGEPTRAGLSRKGPHGLSPRRGTSWWLNGRPEIPDTPLHPERVKPSRPGVADGAACHFRLAGCGRLWQVSGGVRTLPRLRLARRTRGARPAAGPAGGPAGGSNHRSKSAVGREEPKTDPVWD